MATWAVVWLVWQNSFLRYQRSKVWIRPWAKINNEHIIVNCWKNENKEKEAVNDTIKKRNYFFKFGK